MEEKILYNVLRAISNKGTGSSQAPDQEYLMALKNIGLINLQWDTELTSFGRDMLSILENRIPY